MFERLDDPKVYDDYQATIDLLHWVLIGLRDPNIKSVNKDSVRKDNYFYTEKSQLQ